MATSSAVYIIWRHCHKVRAASHSRQRQWHRPLLPLILSQGICQLSDNIQLLRTEEEVVLLLEIVSEVSISGGFGKT